MANTLAAKSDAQYQAEADVRTLAEARRIEADRKRLKAAQGAARRMLTEQQQKTADLEEVAEGAKADKEPD